MAEICQFRDSTILQQQNIDGSLHTGSVQPRVDFAAVRFCAYNQTGQRFISNEVELADPFLGSLEDLFSLLTPDSGAGVWMDAIRTLSATSCRFPVDLVYLDESCAVLGRVQSFPIARVPAVVGAVSILVLPAGSVVSARINERDQLIVCSPEQMRSRLQLSPALSIIKPQLVQNASSAPSRLIDNEENDGLRRLGEQPQRVPDMWEMIAVNSASERSRVEETEVGRATKPPSQEDQSSDAKRWWQKLLHREPADPRKAERAALPGLIAYFFTGGAPTPHQVRDISTSGLYVQTTERWYRGTVVRITLTDERGSTAERSITLHAKVIRWTEDGVALQFMLHEKNERLRGTASTLDQLSAGSSVEHIEDFIERYKLSL